MFAKINQKRFCSFLAANVQQYNKYEIQISNDNNRETTYATILIEI